MTIHRFPVLKNSISFRHVLPLALKGASVPSFGVLPWSYMKRRAEQAWTCTMPRGEGRAEVSRDAHGGMDYLKTTEKAVNSAVCVLCGVLQVHDTLLGIVLWAKSTPYLRSTPYFGVMNRAGYDKPQGPDLLWLVPFSNSATGKCRVRNTQTCQRLTAGHRHDIDSLLVCRTMK